MKNKIILFLCLLILMSGIVSAGYQTIYNPFTSKMDYVVDGNLTTGTFVNLTVTDTSTLNSLTVGGESTFNDNVNINGNLTVIGDVIVANVTELDINGSIYPAIDDTFDLGSAALRWLSGYIKDLYVATFKSNVDFDSNNITGVTEITSTLVDTTNLEADNLKSNLDGTGYKLDIQDVIATGDVNSTDVYTTNLYATNLESDLDATGYSIIASTELAGITGDFDNLEATNLESNLDATGFNITMNILNAMKVIVDTNLTLDNDGTDSRITSLMGDVYLTSADDIRTDKDFVMGDDTINYELFSIEVNGTDIVFSSPEGLPFYFGDNVSASSFIGDGSLLTGLSSGTNLSRITDNVCNDSINMNSKNLNNVVIVEGAGQPVYIGDYSSVGHVSGQDDLYVSDEIEVDGTSYFDGNTWHYGNNRMRDDTELEFGSSAADILLFETAQNPDSTVLALGSGSRHMLFVEKGDQGYNFGHATSTHPTIFLHSSNQNQNQWLSFNHNSTVGRIDTGVGSLFLNPAGNVLLPDNVNVTWANGASISVNSTCLVLTSPGGTGEYAVCD